VPSLGRLTLKDSAVPVRWLARCLPLHAASAAACIERDRRPTSSAGSRWRGN
jgi:hypothetical protein